jgi:hypothetical protein
MRWSILIVAAVASGALAQATPLPPAASDDTIIVTARSGAVTRSYVDRVARPEPGRQLARWNTPLCIKYDGLDEKYSNFIHARIVERAAKVGLRMAGPNCRGAILVKLTDEADTLARALVHMNPPRLGSVTSRMLPSRRVIAALEAPQTIRWLTASATVNQDGMAISEGENPVWSASLIRSPTREVVHSKIILIDAVRLANVSMNQLADYIAFVTLASPDPAASFAGTDSIMALFTDTGAGPTRMTRQDVAFLEALYTVPPDRPAATQKAGIRARVAEGGDNK